MLSKREFIGLYDQAVFGIRQIKNNNDKINKNIGIVNQTTLIRQTQSDKHIIENQIDKVNELISKMESNYLDPDTARKIGVVKQQFRIQKDRRLQLIQNVTQITKQFQHKRPKDEDFSPSKNKKTETPKHFIQMGTNNDYYKKSMITDIDNQTQQTDHQQHKSQMEDYEYQIQQKLIHDRAQQLSNAHQKMINIQNIVTQTSELAYQQGQKLDIITDDLFITYKNVTFGNHELDQANQNQKKSKKKIIVLSLFLLACVGVFVLLMFAL